MTELALDDLLQFLRDFRGELISDARSTEKIDRQQVEAAIKQVYSLMNQSMPTVVWLENPWQLGHSPACFRGFCTEQLRVSRLEESIGRRIRSKIEEELGGETFDLFFNNLWSVLPQEELAAVSRLANREIFVRRTLDADARLWMHLRERLLRWGAGLGSGVRVESSTLRVLDTWRSQRAISRLAGEIPSWDGNVEWCWRSLLRLSMAEVARRFLGLGFEQEEEFKLNSCLMLAESAHAYICFEEVCFLSERPTELYTDENNRIHHENGPAVRYRDQFEIYAWHGTRVPSYAVIAEPRLDMIDLEWNAEVRRVLIERYGVVKYLVDSGAEIVHQDEFGTLYRKEMPSDEPIVMVEVTNSTLEPDGGYRTYFLRVPPNMATAREAVAWTFGMSANDYRPVFES